MQKIDARGRVCPLPLFYVKHKIEKMQIGDEVEIIVDDPTAKDTIPKWSVQHGHEIVAIEDIGDNQFRIVVMKKENKKD
jgi:TusA-related sulfurtransferase